MHDLKEFWHIGRSLPQGHPLEHSCRPTSGPPKSKVSGNDRAHCTTRSKPPVRASSSDCAAPGLPARLVRASVEDGNSVMRLLHYPPAGRRRTRRCDPPAGHEDINTITLLLGAEEAGLELLTKKGEWRRSMSRPARWWSMSATCCNGRPTGGSSRPRTGWSNPRGEAARRSRYSMPFFLHFRPDFLIEPLPECIDESAATPPPAPITAHDFLMERLREIDLA